VGKAAQQQGGADDVEHMIDVIAVARPLEAPDARERAIEAVAKPVQRQRGDDEPHGVRVPTQEPVPDAREQHGREREAGEVIGVHPARHPLGEPDEELFFAMRKHASMLANVVHRFPPVPKV
jgi:hypothetical protein